MRTLLFLTLCIYTIHFNAQVNFNYTYNGTGYWTDTANWSPSYPGTMVTQSYTVIIPSGSSITIDTPTSIYGKITVDGSIKNTSNFNIVGTFICNGTFTNNSLFSNFGTSTFNNTVTSTSVFTNEGIATFKSTFENNASLITKNGGVTNIESTLNNTSSIKVEFSGNLLNTGTINNTNTASISNNGTITNENIINSYTFTNNNTIINDVGTITFGNSVFYLMGNNVSHTGNNSFTNRISPKTTVDANYNTIFPANPIGTYTFNNNATLQNSSRIEIDLKADNDYDKIMIGGIASLSGIVEVRLVDGYDPAIGTKLTFLEANNGITGTFSNTILPSLGSSKSFRINYNANGVELEVVSALSNNDVTKNNFSVYPNPTNNVLHINNLKGNETFILTNITGQKVLETTISPYKNNIDLSNLKPAIYIATIANSSFKILKN
ncbi:T9SS type A sorting domain-containing protein [Seonamhaeicola algicola]|uniref:T9SS type A sorting domain-containing protein n=1 Tax=Seonamhaeicola algicola TaxID=1719036 RepID=A0A5C7AVC8_9FLAO|nr:T9SS type A sorting domain-containing protein [Seonamhaeicola algicola]TXE11613.1 T9SS type A sorting domain-containing protein [Seonamhaeicola algicola]